MNAHVNNTDQVFDTHSEFLTFTLGEEQYGVDILKVQEIRGWEPLRELPDAPAYMIGVLDFRGDIIPILDLRIRFGISDYEYIPTTVIIVLSSTDEASMMGVVVDAVSDVLAVSQTEIKPSPNMGSKIKTDYIIGMVSQESGMIMLVDSNRLVDPDEFESMALQLRVKNMVKKSARKKTAVKKSSSKKDVSRNTPKQAVGRSRNVLDYDPLAWLDEADEAAEAGEIAAHDTTPTIPPDSEQDDAASLGADADSGIEPDSGAYGFFIDAPAQSDSTTQPEPANSDEAAYGFFTDAPAADDNSSGDEAAFGFFDDAPGHIGMHADQDLPDGAINLGAELTIRTIADTKRQIDEVMLEQSRVRLAAASLQKIDSAGLQMLYSLKSTLVNNHQAIEWLSDSELIDQAAASLGLPALTAASSNTDAQGDEGFGFF